MKKWMEGLREGGRIGGGGRCLFQGAGTEARKGREGKGGVSIPEIGGGKENHNFLVFVYDYQEVE